MTPLAVGALVGVAAAGAGLAVHRFAHQGSTRRLWWVGSALAGGAVVPAVGTPVPVGAALAGAGLMAAAVVDALEGRIPTPVAHATTAVSLVALGGHGAVTGEWGVVGRAVLLAAGLTLGLAVLWVIGGMGFGDVRLAGGLVTAMTGGARGLVVLVYAALLVTTVGLVVRRATGRRDGTLPFGPALVFGWLCAVVAI